MRIGTWSVALFLVVSGSAVWAQGDKDVETVFENSLAKQQFVLRNFSGEDQVRATWTGTALQLDEPSWRTLGVLNVDAVKLNGAKLTLSCKRHVVIKDKNDKTVLYADARPVEIDIDLGNADPTEILLKLKDELFFASLEDALGAIPDSMRRAIPARIDKRPGAFSGSPQAQCDCANKDKPDCAALNLKPDGMTPQGMTAPKYVSGDPAKFTEEAERLRLKGSVDVALIVNEKGNPTNVWITRPLGKGLDEAAANSVLSYVFRPAKCHDKPVPVFLYVDVAFQSR